MHKATFAGGCFWGIEEIFRKRKGVTKTTVGYMGGKLKNPSYEQVCTGKTGHMEVVQLEYDPQKVSYEQLLDIFWNAHDPTTLDRQGPDIGTQYKSAILYHNETQKKLAIKSKEKHAKIKNILTIILPVSEFYKAEEYHQQYLKKMGLPICHF